LKEELDIAIEQGQNFSRKFKDDITVGMPVRSCLYLLPQAIKIFSKKYKDISITPQFNGFYHPEAFLKGTQDIFFTFDDEMKHVPDIKQFHLYKSRIYLLTKKEDKLAKKEIANIYDLEGQTLMVGGGSPPALRRLQQKIISSVKINYFNSPDHETTMTNIASDKGICLTPGFFNDHNGEFAWTDFECSDYFDCKLCIHSKDKRESVLAFVKILQKLYSENKDNLKY
jgi:DNA-binding transcriptional LysR family regulator